MILTQTLEMETSATVMGLVGIIANILPPTGPSLSLMTSCNDLVHHHLTVCLKLHDTNFGDL